MDFAFSQAQEDVAAVARQVFARGGTWQTIEETGLLDVEGLLEMCVLLEEQGRACVEAPLWQSLAASLAMRHCGKSAPPGLVLALGEGTAEQVGGEWLLSGERNAVPARATKLLVGTPEGLALVDAALVKSEPQVITTGETARRVTMERARGEWIGDAAAVEWVTRRAHVMLCALQLGVAERALAMTASYTSTRQQFDRPIATFQAVAQRAADAYIDVEAVRLTMWRAAWLLSEGRDDEARLAVPIARWWAAEAGHRVAYAAQHLHGGIGFDVSYPLGRCYLWSRLIELTLGSASSHLARAGAELARSA